MVVLLFLVKFQSWLAPWSTVQGGIDFIELSLHGFDPIAASHSGNFTNASCQFDLSLLRFMQFIIADSLVAVERVLWANVQRGQDCCIETKCQCAAENGVGTQNNVAALFQAGGTLGQIAVRILQATESRYVLFGQVTEACNIH